MYIALTAYAVQITLSRYHANNVYSYKESQNNFKVLITTLWGLYPRFSPNEVTLATPLSHFHYSVGKERNLRLEWLDRVICQICISIWKFPHYRFIIANELINKRIISWKYAQNGLLAKRLPQIFSIQGEK